MLIAGLQKTSFVDFPGQPAAVVFTPYCNFNCTYCHNVHILGAETELIPEEFVFTYLEKRRGLLQALVISGGEPTLQQNLDAFIRQARSMSYSIKLDTNGSKPEVLKSLLHDGLLDYVAMDIKAPLEKYEDITGVKAEPDVIRKSISILRNSGVKHEFRLTYAPQLSISDVVCAAQLVKGCNRFYLQQYRPRNAEDPRPHAPSVVQETAERVRQAIGTCTIRGMGIEQP